MDKRGVSRFTLIGQRDLIVVSMLSVACFLIDASLGLVLIPLIPIPLVGGLLSCFFEAVLTFISMYTVPRVGGPMVFATLWLAMASITPSFGPPGPWKILIGVGLGLTAEILLLVIGRSPMAYVIGITVAFSLSIPTTYAAWVLFGIPSSQQLRSYIPLLTGLYAIIAAAGAYVGSRLYESRFSRYPVIASIRRG
jgi:hypothetical protein